MIRTVLGVICCDDKALLVAGVGVEGRVVGQVEAVDETGVSTEEKPTRACEEKEEDTRSCARGRFGRE